MRKTTNSRSTEDTEDKKEEGPQKLGQTPHNYNVGFIDRVKAFFEIPPKHNLKVGDLVTCTCHGGVAIVIELFDDPKKVEYPKMNMAKIWWINRAYSTQARSWMHTIGRLNKYGEHWPE